MQVIRAGKMEEAIRSSGEWLYLDVGFAAKSRSCGFLEDGKVPNILTFAETRDRLLAIVKTPGKPLNLVLEAPLSIAFCPKGNPVGRAIERRDEETPIGTKNAVRYWYMNLGCGVLVSATHLIRAITNTNREREVRLFEGFASFKKPGTKSSHINDVLRLRDVIHENRSVGRVVPPNELKTNAYDELQSAFAVSGMNYGVPPVVLVGA